MNSSRESVPDYLNNNIFPTLLNAMEEMLLEADRRNALEVYYFLDNCIALIVFLQSMRKIYLTMRKKCTMLYRHINALSMDWIISQKSFGIVTRIIQVDCVLG